jgi:hypothetical protein
MVGELDVLRILSERLMSAGIHFMLTGSCAMAFYMRPRDNSRPRYMSRPTVAVDRMTLTAVEDAHAAGAI